MDDIVVWGASRQEHDERLEHALLRRLEKLELRLNYDKCAFRQPQITYMGELVTGRGVLPDPLKVQAIHDMPVPTGPEDLQRALGLASFMRGSYRILLPELSV